MDQDIITWEALEHEPRENSTDWYWALGIISISVALASILIGNILFAVVILMGAVLLALHTRRDPRVVRHEINTRGIVSDRYLYPYETLESFWVEHPELPNPKLIVKSKKTFVPYIILPLDDIDGEYIRYYLGAFLKEEPHSEPLSHKIMEYLGF